MNTKDVQGNLEFQKIHDTQSLKVEFGHTISIYHHIVLATCWKYSRSWERLMFANRRRKWRISMWTRRFGVYSCLSRFKLTRLFDEFTIRQESILETCGTIVPDNWEVDQKADGDRRIVHVWLEPANLENHHYCVTELFEFWIPKPASFPTRRFTREASVQNQFNLEKTMKWYLENRSLKDVDRIDREPMEFEWTICPGFATLWILNEIQNMMAELQCEPEQFQGRIIFMSMFREFVWVNSRKWRQLCGEFHECRCMCQEASQTVNGTKLLMSWCSTLLRVRYFSPPVREEVNWKVKEVERSPFTSTEAKKPLVISVNQPSIYGVVADLCKELDPDSRNHNEGEISESLVIPTEIPNANAISQSSTSLAQGDLLQNYERKFAEIIDDQKWSRLCKDAGFLKKIKKVQFVIAIEEGSSILQTACREYTQSWDIETWRPRGWIRSDTKIGLVLDGKLYLHEGRYYIDIMIDSELGINKYVTEKVRGNTEWECWLVLQHGETSGKGWNKAKICCEFKCQCSSSWEKWMDVDPQPFDRRCFDVSKFMNWTLRHDSSFLREENGAVRVDDLIEKFKKLVILCGGQLILGWMLWQKEEERKRDFNAAWILTSWINSCDSGQIKDIQEKISLIHYCKTIHCCRVTLQSTSTTSGTLSKCTPLFNVDWSQEDEATARTDSQCSSQLWTRLTFNLIEEKLSTIRINPESHRTNKTWRSHHNAVFWCNLQLAQRKGSIKLGRTQSLFQTHYERFVSTNWFAWKQGENFTAKHSPGLPWATLVPNSQHSRKNLLVTDSRKSNDREKDQHRETRGSEYCIDFSNPRHSTFRCWTSWDKSRRKSSTNNWGIWNHRNRNMLLKDFEKSEEINHFNRESKDLITELGNNETRLLRKDNVPIAPFIRRLVSCTAHAENACSLRRWIDNTTKTDLTDWRFLKTKKRTNPMVLGMVKLCVK